jgi:hypothetical protein
VNNPRTVAEAEWARAEPGWDAMEVAGSHRGAGREASERNERATCRSNPLGIGSGAESPTRKTGVWGTLVL